MRSGVTLTSLLPRCFLAPTEEQRVGPTRDRPLLPFAPPFPPCPFLRPHLRCARFGTFCRLLRLSVSRSRLEDHLPEGLRTAYEPPSPAARRVINDPEALAIANEALAKAALQLREVMTQEEWVRKYGAKRMAQIASIVRALGGSPACKPPDPLDQRYSKRGWNGAVRRWAGGETRARAEARRPDEPESEV